MIGLVILNYKTYTDTLDLIKSISELELPDDFKIFVVDNESNDEKLNTLQECVEKFELNISYLVEKENAGFANGMNRGIFAAKLAQCKYVFCSNNDVLLPEGFSFSKMVSNYSKDNTIAMIGPRIVNLSNEEQNPLYIKDPFENKLKAKIIKLVFLTPLVGSLIYISRGMLNNYVKNDRVIEKEVRVIPDEVYSLHGSFFALTPSYFSFYEGLDENTFLYYEELILSSRIKSAGLRVCFDRDQFIVHKEDSSTNATFKNRNFEKNLFVLKENYRSLKYFLQNYIK